MIVIDRKSVPVPKILADDSRELIEERERAEKHFRRAPTRRRQTRFRFNTDIIYAPEVRAAIHTLFNGKCAYCESPIGTVATGEVDRYRSRGFSSNLDGSISQDHYWWLAYEWSNLYAACTACGRCKGRRFPVDGPRAPKETPASEIDAKEKALLLDPCRDDPDAHLAFDEKGLVTPLSKQGATTIEVLALNRHELVMARRAALAELLETLRQRNLNDIGDRWFDELQRIVSDPSQPFLAAKRQVVARELKKAAGVGSRELPLRKVVGKLLGVASEMLRDPSVMSLVSSLPTIVPAAGQMKRLVKDYLLNELEESLYSVESGTGSPSFFARTRVVQSVEIKNFRKIKNLRLDFQSGDSQRAPWTMLLGDNGLGKSSILQAIAMTLCGAKYLEELDLQATNFLRRNTSEAHIKVVLSNFAEPLTLRIDARGFHASADQAKVLILGYGATRLLPRKSAPPRFVATYAKLENLFDPFEPVGDAEAWLNKIPQAKFDDYARALKELFFVLDGPEQLIRTNGKIVVRTTDGDIPLSQLSDGYQSVIGVTTDIMRVLSHYWDAMEVAEGIVLIDELGAHLHPRWRLRVVSGLRNAFPRVQFIASTHDPLCLRGLENGEVIVLRANAKGETFAILEAPFPGWMRVEQLLTSELFGLYSTTDPELDAWFNEYINAKRSGAPPSGSERLARVSQELKSRSVLGNDRRERLMLETIDEYLAKERDLADGGERSEARKETKVSLARLWREIAPVPIANGDRRAPDDQSQP
ncbi:AAA family ATPase [Rhizobium sp. CCGE 510]|uniref:AAA family ATPase n=1 Tax=Rhizobium sp. CCGE 510 TaxID=1132836 RepID=UPI00027B8D19|nr:AAA family ATPase [Rhizobium sp. CCGE 510]EJT01465.1 AAA ATPase [Rhizobium sp. CCGE 510]